MDEKLKMLKLSNKYIKNVSGVISACETAKKSINSASSSIAKNWKGESGSAMTQSLKTLTEELNSAISLLQSAEANMRSEARAIESHWPEEENE